MTLAPDADRGPSAGPAQARSYSEDPAIVARFSAAAVRAYGRAGVVSAPGRFPGEGTASQDPGLGAATVGLDLATLRRDDVRPFAAVAATAPAIQMSNAVYAAWDGVTPASLLPDAYALLRHDLRFRGVAMTGDLTAAAAVAGSSTAQAAVDALGAGADLLVVPGDASDQEAAFTAVLGAVQRGTVPRARLAQALARMTELRVAYG